MAQSSSGSPKQNQPPLLIPGRCFPNPFLKPCNDGGVPPFPAISSSAEPFLPSSAFLMCNLCHLCRNLGPLFVALPTFLEERSRADEIRARGREDILRVSWEASLADLSVVFSLAHFSCSGFHSIKPSSERAVL